MQHMARSSSETTDIPKRAPRRRVAKVVAKVATPVASEVSVTPRRKAPTQLRAESGERSVSLRRSRARIYIPLSLLVVGFGAAALIGFSDDGQININEVVAKRNAAVSSATNENGGENPSGEVVIPVQNNLSTVPDGGLKISGAIPEPVPIPEVASSTEVIATSTASTTVGDALELENEASSTESVPAATSEAI
jgi:hypothetical protein